MPQQRFTQVQSIVETVAMVLVAVAVVWMALGRSFDRPNRPPAPRGEAPQAAAVPTEPVSLAGAEIDGGATAKVALLVYSDFECPFCARFARDTLPQIQERYVRPGRVLVAFRHYPLPNHQFARQAAEAAECAGRQGEFWKYHDLLFLNPKRLDRPSLDASARDVGLDTVKFAVCMAGQASADVEADRSRGEPLGVSGTPTFFAGLLLEDGRLKVSERISGALPFDAFRAVLDRMLGSDGTNGDGTTK